MKNVLRDNRGYMLIEIIVASVIALVMVYFLVDITVKLVNKNNDYYIDSLLVADKNIITKEIMDDINSKKLVKVEKIEDGKFMLYYDDNSAKKLTVDSANSMITYGNYSKKVSDKLNLGGISLNNSNNILTISLNMYTNYSEEDYGIKIIVPHSENIEIIYPDFPDLLINNITLNGNKVNNFPDGNYDVSMNCNNNVNVKYDYFFKKIIVSDIYVEQNAICQPELITTSRMKFADKIISLLGSSNVVSSTSDSDGSTLEKITENGVVDYRYRGIDPNNYVWFNDELWRIIGVFDDNSHGIDNTHLVKIIRNDSIGNYLWEKTVDICRNNYPGSDIFQLLNDAYYNAKNGTGEEYCYGEDWGGKKCNFTKVGLQEEYRKMVEDGVNWFLGGSDSSKISSSEMYKRERGTKVHGINANSTKSVGAKSPIGLMYASDYGYAVSSKCESNLFNYNNLGCADNNWLKSISFEYTITHRIGSYLLVWAIHNSGDLNYSADVAGADYDVRPVLYLKSNVFYLAGEGTQTNPYIISFQE